MARKALDVEVTGLIQAIGLLARRVRAGLVSSGTLRPDPTTNYEYVKTKVKVWARLYMYPTSSQGNSTLNSHTISQLCLRGTVRGARVGQIRADKKNHPAEARAPGAKQ